MCRSDGVNASSARAPDGFLVAFSGRGVAPEDEPSPTRISRCRFARALALDGMPIVRATQVHGNRAVTVARRPAAATRRDAGECDVLATDAPRRRARRADGRLRADPARRSGTAVADGARGLARHGEERGRVGRRRRSGSSAPTRAPCAPGSARRSARAATRSAARSRRSSPGSSCAPPATGGSISTFRPSTAPSSRPRACPPRTSPTHPALHALRRRDVRELPPRRRRAGRMIGLVLRRGTRDWTRSVTAGTRSEESALVAQSVGTPASGPRSGRRTSSCRRGRSRRSGASRRPSPPATRITPKP